MECLNVIFELPKTFLGEELRWGVLRIAVLSLLNSLFSSIFSMIVLIGVANLDDLIGVANQNSNVRLFLVFFLITEVVELICSVFLFIGVIRENTSKMLAWLWLYVAYTIIYLLLIVAGTLATAVAPHLIIYTLGPITFLLPYIAVTWYLCQVVHALIIEADRRALN